MNGDLERLARLFLPNHNMAVQDVLKTHLADIAGTLGGVTGAADAINASRRGAAALQQQQMRLGK